MTASPESRPQSKSPNQDARSRFNFSFGGDRLKLWRALVPPAVVLVLILLILRLVGLLQPWELSTYDFMMSNRSLETPDPRITIVGITEEDIQTLQHYPIYDSELAQVLRSVSSARVIGLVLFRDIPVEPGYEELLKTYSELPNFIGIELVDDVRATPTIPGPVTIPQDRVGFANVLEDDDWILRRMLLTSADDPNKQALALRLATAYLDQEGYKLTTTPFAKDPGIHVEPCSSMATEENVNTIITTLNAHTGGYVNETIWGKGMMLNFRHHPDAFTQLTLGQILRNDFDPELVRDRIVLIGNIAASNKDTLLTAGRRESLWSQSQNYTESIPFSFGVEVHAHATSQLISRVLDRRWGIWSFPEVTDYILIVLAGILGTGIGLTMASPLGRLLGLVVLSGGLVLLCFFSLDWFGLWLPLLPCLLALAVAGVMTLFVDWELSLKLRQSKDTLAWAYEAVHNGPLQTLAVLQRKTPTQEELPIHLDKLNQDLRSIYESMREEIEQGGTQFCMDSTWLDANDPLPLLLTQVHQLTINRDFPGFDSIGAFITPQLAVLKECRLTVVQKKMICAFVEEALCNIGKHARGARRVDVIGESIGQKKKSYRIIVSDNGETPQRGFTGKAGRSANLPQSSRSAQYKSQGTKQMERLARALGGKFERLPNQPQGTICQLTWPAELPLRLRLWRLLRRL